jgi:solute carrier family 12 sodium/potassium/chloride transporter 2
MIIVRVLYHGQGCHTYLVRRLALEYTSPMSLLSRAGDYLRRIRNSTRKADGGQQGTNHAVTAEFTGERQSADQGHLRTLGTFGGVFTPSFLTIIGVIMYLRFSWVVANAGLWHTILIVVLANVITFITALSVSSIASNERMETGGAYFMVSRVLGYQAGGGIGIPLYLSQALSIALYIIGFAESLNNLLPALPIRAISLVSLAVLTGLSLLGAGVMVKVQYVIFGFIALSFVSIALGFSPGQSQPVLLPAYAAGESFWDIFKVFFPAVTGILAGVSMSGDLKDPAKSIPRGTLLAVLVGFLIYLLVPIMLAFTLDRGDLYPSSALANASRWPFLVSLGVFGATLSSAIGSLMGAPRTLQALGHDRILPKFFSRGFGKTNEPLTALALSLAMAFVVLLIGDLNAVAEILTMFFLTTYGVLNFSAAMERFVDNPSFRPAVKIHWSINLLGALGCFAVMFLISWVSTLIALALVIAVFAFVGRSARGPVGAGGLWEGFWTRAFFAVLHRLEKTRTGSGKNWRPMIQVFASDPTAHTELVGTAAMLTSQGGSLSAYAMIDPVDRDERIRIQKQMERMATRSGSGNAFVTVVETGSLLDGVVVASQASGFAGALHNTVMLGLPSGDRNDRSYLAMLKQLVHINRNLLLFRKGSVPWTENSGRIQVWWGGQETNVRLMLILAYLLQQNQELRREISLATIVPDDDSIEAAEHKLQATLKDLRLQGEIRIIVNRESRPISEVILEESTEASIVLLGMARPDDENNRGYLDQLRKVAVRHGAVLYVLHNISDQAYE